jgi:hypothetical protein
VLITYHKIRYGGSHISSIESAEEEEMLNLQAMKAPVTVGWRVMMLEFVKGIELCLSHTTKLDLF